MPAPICADLRIALDQDQAMIDANVAADAVNATEYGRPEDVELIGSILYGPDGRLWIVEDNFASDIWVADKDLDGDGAADGVNLFASLKDSGADGTGIYFGKDPHTLFVNHQHTAADRDGTWAITTRPGSAVSCT